jgi:SecD/SecF fusion protein
MQNKGAIRLFAIVFSLVCLYQLSFTVITSRIEKKAQEVSQGDTKKELEYLQGRENEVVYNLLVKKYTYKECRERQLNLGLDLKGGMNVTLEVNVQDIIHSLSNNSNDPTFLKAIAIAQQLQLKSQDDFVTLFGKAFTQVDPNAKLAAIFSTKELSDKIKYNSSNAEVLKVLTKEADDAINNSFNILRSRIDKFGVVSPNIQKLGTRGRILVELPGVKDKERVRNLLQGTAKLEFWETYENSAVYKYLVAANAKIAEIEANGGIEMDTTAAQTDTAIVKSDIKSKTKATPDTAKKELSLLAKIEKGDTTKADSTAMGSKMAKQYPLFSILQPAADQKQLFPGPVVGYANVKDTSKINRFLHSKQISSLFPRDLRFYWGMKPSKRMKTGEIVELIAIKASGRDGRAPLDGNVITGARTEFGQGKAEASVSMTMNAEGTKTWARLTKDNIGKSIAIVLDGYVVSYPTVNTEITGGSSQITGNFTINEATDLAIVLKSGEMPARAVIVQEAVVGPSLGQASIDDGMRSFVIAILLVLFYLVFYYGRAGVIADIALILNTFFTFGVLASLNAVITLPGIAGIVLSFGMSVDANVITYERIREELRTGKGLRAAITDGYNDALSSIVDGNVTVVLTGVVLYLFGTGPIRGFATTLVIGVIISMFTAVLFSHFLFENMLNRNRKITFSNKITANVLVGAHFDFIGKRKIFYIISGIIITIGIGSMFTRGFDLGIDFSGGRTYIVKFDKPVNTVDLQNSLTGAFDGMTPEVKTFGLGGNQVKIATKFMNDPAHKNMPGVDSIVETRLYKGLTPYVGASTYDAFKSVNLQSSEKVGPTIADDIKVSAVWAVLCSLLIVFLYVFVRFKDWQFGLGAVVSLAHDTLIVLGVYTIFWNILPFSLEIDQSFIAAILTVIGYSVNDSVIIFDRIREYNTLFPKRPRMEVYNDAINHTLTRTLNTALITMFTIVVVFIFGGVVLRGFIFAMMVGVAVGTYSSVFNAAPIVYDALNARDRNRQKKAKKA